MSHSEILKATQAKRASVVLTEHTNCERGFLANVLQERLDQALNGASQQAAPSAEARVAFNVLVSEVDRDPITFYHHAL